MRQVIDGKLYDTETAEQLHDWDNGRFGNDFRRRSKTLYRTSKGGLFLHHDGGPMTDMAVSVGSSGYGGSESIEPISERDAIRFLESHGGTDVLLERFPHAVEEG